MHFLRIWIIKKRHSFMLNQTSIYYRVELRNTIHFKTNLVISKKISHAPKLPKVLVWEAGCFLMYLGFVCLGKKFLQHNYILFLFPILIMFNKYLWCMLVFTISCYSFLTWLVGKYILQLLWDQSGSCD